MLSGIAHDHEAEDRIASFVKGLAELGWVQGRNISIEYRWAAGDAERARFHAIEVLGFGPDVILANGTAVVAALQRETRTLPIVFVLGLDPVESGFVAGLARPGGNITGFTTFEPEMGGKWLEVLKEIAPRVLRIGVIFNPQTQPFHATFLRSIEAAASSFSV